MIARHLGHVEPKLAPDYRRLSRMGDPTVAMIVVSSVTVIRNSSSKNRCELR